MSIRRINFSIVEARQQALEKLNSMPIVDRPFGMGQRFPANDFLISEAIGDWSRKFQQLRSALSFKERHKEVSLKTNELPSSTDASFNDAQQAFSNATTNIIDQLVRCDGVYDQERFETFYGLIWAN